MRMEILTDFACDMRVISEAVLELDAKLRVCEPGLLFLVLDQFLFQHTCSLIPIRFVFPVSEM